MVLCFVLNLEVCVALQFEVAMTTTGGRAKFVESMEGIMKGVKQVQLASLLGIAIDIIETLIKFMNCSYLVLFENIRRVDLCMVYDVLYL